jgi:integrating conjugative element, PFGI_1 class, parB family protein
MINNENAYDVALGGVDLNLDTPPDDKTLVGRNAVISINLDDIHEFALNPRRADNPLFAEIKASIATIGLQQPLKVTRRPGEAGYTLYDGGNTRLRALKQLWQETHDEKFFYQRCHFVPYVSDADILLHHMVENEVRGEMTLLDKSLAVWRLKSLYEQGQDKSLSVRELVDLLGQQGWTIKRSMASVFVFTAQHLADRLPQALAAGMGKPRIEEIRKTFHAIHKYVDERFATPQTLSGEAAQRGYLDHLAATDDADFAADCLDAALSDCCADIGKAFAMDRQLVYFELQQLCETGTLYRSEPLPDVAQFERDQAAAGGQAANTATDKTPAPADSTADTGHDGNIPSADTGRTPGTDTEGAVPTATEPASPTLSPLEKADDVLHEQIRHLRLRYPLVQRHLDEQNDPPFCIPAEHALTAIREELAQAGARLDPLDAAFNDEEAVLYMELTDFFAGWFHLQWDYRRAQGEEDTLPYWADCLQQVRDIQMQLQPLRPYLSALHYGFSIHDKGQEAQRQFARLAAAIHDYLRVADREE